MEWNTSSSIPRSMYKSIIPSLPAINVVPFAYLKMFKSSLTTTSTRSHIVSDHQQRRSDHRLRPPQNFVANNNASSQWQSLTTTSATTTTTIEQHETTSAVIASSIATSCKSQIYIQTPQIARLGYYNSVWIKRLLNQTKCRLSSAS